MNYVMKVLIEFEAFDDVEARNITKELVNDPSIQNFPGSMGGKPLKLRGYSVKKEGSDHLVVSTLKK